VQQRQLAKSSLETPAARESARPRGAGVHLSFVGACAALLSFFAVGCPQPGDLENAEAYPADPSVPKAGSNGGGSGGMSGGTACEDTACVKEVLTTCNGCHGAAKLGKLDLQSAGVASRLKDVASAHDSPGPGAQCPTGDKLVDSANVAESWLLKKITGQQGTCGTKMPAEGLEGAQLQCMKDFVSCVANGSSSAAGGTGGTGGT
jgi:hypothetical protein